MECKGCISFEINKYELPLQQHKVKGTCTKTALEPTHHIKILEVQKLFLKVLLCMKV